MNQNYKQKKRILQASVFASVLSILRIIVIINMIGDEGGGIYAAAYELYSISIIIASFCLTQTVSKMITARLSRGQVRNAHKVFTISLLFCILTGILCSILLEVLANSLTSTFLLQGNSVIALKWLAPTILFAGISGCIKGYLKGVGETALVVILQITEQIIIWVLSILGAQYFYKYGLKVGILLKDTSYGAVYGAAGSMLGITVGSFLSLIILIVMYKNKYSMIHKMIAKDATIKDESHSQVFQVIFFTTIPIIISSILFSIPTLIDQRIFNKIRIEAEGAATSTAQFGIFYGKFRVFIVLAIIIFIEIHSTVAPTISRMLSSGEQKLVKDFLKNKIMISMRACIPYSVVATLLAKLFIPILYKGNVDTAVMLLQRGSILIILYSLIIITIGVLQGLGKQLVVMIHLLLSFLIHIVPLVFMLKKLQMNIEAVVYSWIILAVIVVILNMLSIGKHLKYRQEWKKSFIIPTIASTIMGIFIILLIYLLNDTLGNVGTIIASVLFGNFIYWIVLIALKGINQKELSKVTGGRLLFKIAKIIRIM